MNKYTTRVACAIALSVGVAIAAEPPGTPNGVFMISDDQGWNDDGFMGHPHLQTSHLDTLARQSLVCERGDVAAPLCRSSLAKQELLVLDNGTAQIGIDPAKGGAITHLSWTAYPSNMVNSADPGRLIQQSYYAGKLLDRTAEGQHPSWSPWSWNPIQGGGVDSWARVTELKRIGDHTLYAETLPKLWDMPDEEADAAMRQWTGFEPGMPDVIAVRCELVANRELDDGWGPAVPRHQEVPACYFTRNFDAFKSYLGEGTWRVETQPPGPPWGSARSPRHAMACFEPGGQGIAIFSPTAKTWNFGPHADEGTTDPAAGPCTHIAPVAQVALGPKSTLSYRYWLVVGDEAKIATRLDRLWEKYATERMTLTHPPSH